MSATDRAKYIREEEEAKYKSKNSKGFSEQSSQSHQHAQRTPSASSHGSGYGGTLSPNISLRHRTISDFLDEGYRNDVDSKVY